MSGKSVIIIGAGLAGLSAGCYCQMNGYDTRIFEHHTVPGGVAAVWRRQGYLIDGGIHFVMGFKPGTALYETYRQLGIVPAVRTVEMKEYGRFIDQANGTSITVTRDLQQLSDDLKAQFPADTCIIDLLIDGARAMQGADLSQMGMGKPPELMNLLDKVREMWGMRRLFRYFTGRYARPAAEFAEEVYDPRLKEFIKYLFLPEVPVWFLIMLLALVAEGQMGFIEGGCLEFVLPIEKRFKALGGQVTYQATVEEILVNDDRTVGVRLADGSEHYADAVISAADGYSTIFKMLNGRYLDEKIRYRYQNWKMFQPMLMISFGAAREFPGEPSFNTILLENPITINSRETGVIFLRIFNYSDKFAPPGKTVVQVEFETEWDYWNELQSKDRPAYEAEKRRVASETLERLEKLYPGITRQVEVTDVATPYTTWRYTLNHRGAWEGWLPTPEVITVPVERTLPGLKDFYMAGQWVMPGGGVVPCLYSGRHAAQLLCRRDGKRFVADAP